MKASSTQKLIIILLLLTSTAAFSQIGEEKKESGIYLTEKDYIDNAVSLLAENDANNSLVEQLGTVVVVRNGRKSKYAFGTIYGYYRNGIKYRSFGSKSKLFGTYGYYKVIDDSGLVIYSKPSSSRRSNGYLFYYYSISPVSAIKSISKKNIQNDFNDKPRFVELISKALDRREYVQRVNGRLLINEIYLEEPSLR
jgi:hypothetical protein